MALTEGKSIPDGSVEFIVQHHTNNQVLLSKIDSLQAQIQSLNSSLTALANKDYVPDYSNQVVCPKPSTSVSTYTVPSRGWISTQISCVSAYSTAGSYFKVNGVTISQQGSYGSRLNCFSAIIPVSAGDVLTYKHDTNDFNDGVYYNSWVHFYPAKLV